MLKKNRRFSVAVAAFCLVWGVNISAEVPAAQSGDLSAATYSPSMFTSTTPERNASNEAEAKPSSSDVDRSGKKQSDASPTTRPAKSGERKKDGRKNRKKGERKKGRKGRKGRTGRKGKGKQGKGKKKQTKEAATEAGKDK